VVVVSAHWTARGPDVTAGGSLLHDFAGFPEALSQVHYPAPRADALAAEVAALVAEPGTGARVVERGLDHGVWAPLVHLLPAADVPVAQVALPAGASESALLALGARLAPLRGRGVLLVGSGAVVHNLERADWSDTRPPACWADDFDHWVGTVVAARDWAALADWRGRAPGAELAHPTDEHLRPLLVVAGAARPEDQVSFPVTGFELGSVSDRSVQLG
jgi:4,5-DOPA dioxygenase extradiol